MNQNTRKNFNVKLWFTFTCLLLVITSLSLIFLVILFYLNLIRDVVIGILFLVINLGITSYVFYDHNRIRKYIQSKILFKSKFFAKIARTSMLFMLILVVPYELNYAIANNQVEKEPSPYDSYIGNQFHVNVTNLVYTNIPGVIYSHCSNLLYLPRSGDILCVWYAGAYEKALDVAIYMSRCHPNMTWDAIEEIDLSLNWSTPIIVADTYNRSEGQPVLYLCPNGRIYLFFQTLRPAGPLFGTWGPYLETGWSLAKIKYQYSDDDGYTWSEPRYFWDFYFWVARNPLLKTRNGDVIFPLETEGNAFFLINKDQNLESNWIKTSNLRGPGSLSQPCLAELTSGRIMSVFRTNNGRIYKSYSNNGGMDWEQPRKMRFPNPDSCVSLLGLQDGRLLMLCNPSTQNRNTLSFILGDETGIYWSEPSYVNKSSTMSFAYPCMIQLPDQSIVYSYSNNGANIGSGRFTLNALNQMLINYEISEL